MARGDNSERLTSEVMNGVYDEDGQFLYTQDDAAIISIDGVTTAIESLEVQQDLTTDAVDLTTAAVVLNTTSVDLVTAEIAARNAIDATTDARIIIDYAHHEVHGGSHFVCSDVQAVDTTSIQWMVTTPNTTKYSHMLFDATCTGEMLAVVTEGADRVGTNLLSCVNRRRIVTPPVAGTVNHRVVSGGTTDGAVILDSIRSGATGGGGKTVSPGSGRGQNEFILAPNTKYILTITTFAAVVVTLHLDWYEHTDK